jgi:hypothetical protein
VTSCASGATPRLRRAARRAAAAWSKTSYQIARLRDNADCAEEEFDALADAGNPGLSVKLSFDAADDIAAPFIATGVRPKVAILREQGELPGEMAAAFDRAGFAPSTCICPICNPVACILPTSRAWRPAAASPTATCWVRAGLGQVHPVQPAPASSSRPSSSAPTPSRWACATAAR